MSRADFTLLDDYEFTNIANVYEFARMGVSVTTDASQILLVAAGDFKRACLHIPVVEGSYMRKATRASRPIRRAAMHLWAAQRCFNVLPRVFVKAYEEELGHAKGRPQGIVLK